MSDNKLMAIFFVAATGAILISGIFGQFDSDRVKIEKEKEKTKQLQYQYKIDSIAVTNKK